MVPQYPHTPAEQPEVPVYQGGIALRCPQCSHVVYTRFCSFCGNDLAVSYAPSGTPVPPAQAEFPPQPGFQPPPAQEWKTLTPPTPPGWNPPPQPGFQPPPAQEWKTLTPPTQERKTQFPKPKGYRPPVGIVLLSILLFLVTFGLSFFGFSALYRRDAQAKPESSIEWTPPAESPSANSRSSNPGGVSLEEYFQLKAGMTYAQVSGIIGDDGILVDTGTNLDGRDYYIYGWSGQDNPLAEVYITFVEDQVVEIVQHNLLNE